MQTMMPTERDKLLQVLKARFDKNRARHQALVWDDVQAKLEGNSKALSALAEMENTGGEPDVIGYDETAAEVLFCDCSAESPSGRRSLCYDRKALDARKENKPRGCVTEAATGIGIELLTEAQYRGLQVLGEFDTKTSSWIATPDKLRALGGALFCDRRYGEVFVYHNGADSYYAARGFRGLLRVK